MNDDDTQAHDPDRLKRQRRFWFWMIWLGVVLTLLPVGLGMGGTILAMNNAFEELEGGGNGGGAEAEALANDVSAAMFYMIGGVAFSALGFVLMICAAIRFLTLPKVE